MPAKLRTAANALGAISWSDMFAMGAAIGGAVTDLFGWQIALGIDAGTYVVSAVRVARIV